MRIRKDESGQVLVMTVLSMVVLLGFMALALDVSLLFRAKRNLQIAADAAATAGALDYYYNSDITNAKAVAKTAATNNGYTDGVDGASVHINIPAQYGGYAGVSGTVEAVISKPSPTVFMRIFNRTSMNVAVRGVAGTPLISDSCVWIMNPTASDSLHLQGNSTINAPNCGIYVNSNSGSAVKVTGNSNSYNGPDLGVVGGYTGHNTAPTGITTGVGATSPPITDAFTGPVPPGGCTTTDSTTTSFGGTYTSQSAGSVVCFTKAVTLTNGASLPGTAGDGVVYVFQNGLTIGVGATVNIGSATYDPVTKTFLNTLGATIDLYGGTLNQLSNSILNVYAPTSGTYNGIAILQPTNNTGQLQVQFGSNDEYIDGMIVAPAAQVYLQDNGGGVTASGLIADTMFVKSSTLNITNYSGANPTTTPFRQIKLIE